MYLLDVSIRDLKYFCVLFVLFVFLFMLLALLRCYTSIFDGFIIYSSPWREDQIEFWRLIHSFILRFCGLAIMVQSVWYNMVHGTKWTHFPKPSLPAPLGFQWLVLLRWLRGLVFPLQPNLPSQHPLHLIHSPHFSPPGLEGLRRQYLIKGESLYSIISQIGAREIL